MKDYFKKLYEARYFWWHLAKIELKNKFRRSKLGILWTFVSPLCLTMIMSVVFATVFKTDIVTYAPYILSGLLFWDVISGSLVSGSYSIISNESYIRQFNHPITIYTLKSAIVYTISFLIALISLSVWIVFVKPGNLVVAILSLPVTLCLVFLFSWAGTTIGAFTNTKYRDYPQMMQLALQALWYLSPVFFQEEMFKSNELLYAWFNINPITHILFLLRKPFLEGQFPSLQNYGAALLVISLMGLLAVYINRRNGKEIIFYI